MYSKMYVSKPKENDTTLIDDTIYTVNQLIKYKDYVNAKKELLKLKYVGYYYPEYEVIINNLKSKIKEEMTIDYEISEDLEYGKFYLESENVTIPMLNNALFYFENGYNKSKHNIFNYYIGRTYYKLKAYDEALKYFKRYAKIGGVNSYKAYVYIATILSKRSENKDFNEAQKAVELAELINKYEPKEMTATEELKYYIYSNKDNE